MPVGATYTKDEINNTAGQIARQVFAAFESVEQFKVFLDTKPDADLIALSFTQAEVTLLKSAIGDLEQLSNIFLGQVNLASVKDFTTFAKQLIGTGLY